MVETWLKILINNYTLQADFYKQVILLSRKEKALLSNGNWRRDIDIIRKSLEQRNEYSKRLEKYNQQNQVLQSKIIKILSINEFKLSNLAGQININTYNLLQEKLLVISEQLNLISQIDDANQKLLTEFISQAHVIESEKNQTKKAIKAYQQAYQQENINKSIRKS